MFKTMKCTRVEKFLPLYVADDLKGRRRKRAVEKHLAACEGCRRAAAEYHASRELFGADALAPDFEEAFYEEIRNSVLTRIGSDRTLAPPRRFSRLFDARFAYAASLALLLIFAALAFQSYTRRTAEVGARHKMTANANHEPPATPAMIKPPATIKTPAMIEPTPTIATPMIETTPAASSGNDERPTPRPAGEYAGGTTGAERRAPKSSTQKLYANVESARNEAQAGSPSRRRAPSHAGRNPHDAPAVVVVAAATAATQRANARELAASGGRAGAAGAQPEISSIEIQTADPNIRIIWLSANTEDAVRPLK